MRRIALVSAIAAALFNAAPAFAFEVQSGGIPLSAEHMGLLASRMAGPGGTAQTAGGLAAAGRPLPPWMIPHDGKAGEGPFGKPPGMGRAPDGRGSADEVQTATGRTALGKGFFAARR